MEATLFNGYGGKQKRLASIRWNAEAGRVECDNWYVWNLIRRGDVCALFFDATAHFTPADGFLYVILAPLFGAGCGTATAIAIRPDDELAPLVHEALEVTLDWCKRVDRRETSESLRDCLMRRVGTIRRPVK